jgi:glycosyltransferase involved in cell wall biosynthesis
MHSVEPLISIILPVYNRKAYIRETINSIRSQSYQNWELLILDDGSMDGSMDIAEEIQRQDARLRSFRFVHTGITGRLKNTGIRLAKGAFICFMDSDDRWPPQKLSMQVDAMQQRPEAMFSFTNGFNFRESDNHIEVYFFNAKEGIECRRFFEEVCAGTVGVRLPTLMIRREVLHGANMFKETKRFTDFSFILNLADQFSGLAIYQPLFERRMHESNSSSEGWISDFEEHTDAIIYYQRQGRLPDAIADRILFMLYMNWGETYLRHGRPVEARKAFLAAWRYNKTSMAPMKKLIRSIVTS